MHTPIKSDYKLPAEKITRDFFDLFNKYLNNRFDRKVFQPFAEADIQQILSDVKPAKQGHGAETFFKILDSTIVEHSMNLHNPLYMGHQVPPTLPVAALTDLIISTMNQSLVVRKMSPVLSMIEKEMINYLTKTIGFGQQAGGSFTSGGSMSNFIGLYGARKKYFPDVISEKAFVLCSDQAHYSVSKAISMIGLSTNNIAIIDSNEHFQIDPSKTEEKIIKLRNKGLKPFVISATSGSTSTGSFDNLAELTRIASEHDLWLHVDAAHGGSLIFSEELKHLIKDINKADSITWDAHKMMYMPASTGICLFKDESLLKNCFNDSHAPYLYNSEESERDLSKLSLQCTRRGDALKLWGALVSYGTEFFAQRYLHACDVTQYFYQKLNTHSDFETIHKPEFNIICFRYNPSHLKLSEEQLNDLNAQIRDQANNTGEIMLTLTSLKGKVCLRATIINPATNQNHIDEALEIIQRVAI